MTAKSSWRFITDCNCDVGGSRDLVCDKDSGQCTCRPRVNGRRCDSPLTNHYFPTLYHHMYEMEEGHSPHGRDVRYGYNQDIFPNFSWRGYAIMSRTQVGNSITPGQNGCHFADGIFKCIFVNENVWIPLKISLKFVPYLNNYPALVQIMAWRQIGDKPLSEPMLIRFTDASKQKNLAVVHCNFNSIITHFSPNTT